MKKFTTTNSLKQTRRQHILSKRAFVFLENKHHWYLSQTKRRVINRSIWSMNMEVLWNIIVQTNTNPNLDLQTWTQKQNHKWETRTCREREREELQRDEEEENQGRRRRGWRGVRSYGWGCCVRVLWWNSLHLRLPVFICLDERERERLKMMMKMHSWIYLCSY